MVNDDEVWMASYAPVADVEDAWLVELKRGVDGLADVVRGEGRVRSGEQPIPMARPGPTRPACRPTTQEAWDRALQHWDAV